MKSKKALSGVVTAVILIGLTVAAISIVWVFVNNMVKDELEGAGSCFDIQNKIEINDMYTCYDAGYLRVSLSIADAEIDEVLVSVGSSDETKSFKITKKGNSESYLGSQIDDTNAITNLGETIYLPEKESGKSYYVDLNSFGIVNVRSIKITPIVGEETCNDAGETIFDIPECDELAS